MAQRPTRNNQQQHVPRKGGSGLLSGIVIGLVAGLALASALAWYLGSHPAFRPAEQRSADTTKSEAAKPEPVKHVPARVEPASPELPRPEPAKAAPVKPGPAPHPAEATPVPKVAVKPESSGQAKVDYTFYGILPGEKPAKPVEPASPPDDTWWLQVAALKMPAEADRLKARLALLGLRVVIQKIGIDNQTLYRVRIGPYKRQDDALADVDTIATNKFEHRLVKEPAN